MASKKNELEQRLERLRGLSATMYDQTTLWVKSAEEVSEELWSPVERTLDLIAYDNGWADDRDDDGGYAFHDMVVDYLADVTGNAQLWANYLVLRIFTVRSWDDYYPYHAIEKGAALLEATLEMLEDAAQRVSGGAVPASTNAESPLEHSQVQEQMFAARQTAGDCAAELQFLHGLRAGEAIAAARVLAGATREATTGGNPGMITGLAFTVGKDRRRVRLGKDDELTVGPPRRKTQRRA